MERGRNNRRVYDARSCTFVSGNTTKNECFIVYGYLKGKSAMMIFEYHANLKYKFGNKHFWAEGYYVSTVGLNKATIRKYIREQENEDMVQDKLTKKEYVNPFKGLLK